MPQNNVRYDTATALDQGARDYQEDAVIADFPVGSGFGMAVLADGMGGHAAGDVASKIVMTEVFCELKFQSGNADCFERNVREILMEAADGANQCIGAHVSENSDAAGMGATLLAVVMLGKHLHWVSVGDSPLYLFRGGSLRQLNEDHSMAPQIDQMVEAGMIDKEAAQNHPDRNALTSVLSGSLVERIDCPEEPFELKNGDVIIVASDGLQFLGDDLEKCVAATRGNSGAQIARDLLDAVLAKKDPEQDNISMTVVKVSFAEADDAMAAALKNAFDVFDTSEPDDRMFEPPQRRRKNAVHSEDEFEIDTTSQEPAE